MLLNGSFDFLDHCVLDTCESQFSVEFRVRRPLCVAAVNGCVEAFGALLAHGAEVLVTETRGNSVFHAMVIVSKGDPATEEMMVCVYKRLCDVMNEQTISTLLHHENCHGQRPLELAAKEGCVKLFSAMFETKGVYMIESRDMGLATYRFYDITDYEIGGRPDRCPLLYFSVMTHCTQQRQETRDFLTSPLMEQWYRVKWRSNYIFLLLWFISRFFPVVLFLTMINNSDGLVFSRNQRHIRNTSMQATIPCSGLETVTFSSNVLAGCFVYLGLYSGLVIITDLAELGMLIFARTPRYLYCSFFDRESMKTALYHRFYQFLTACIIGLHSLVFFTDSGTTPGYVHDLLDVSLALLVPVATTSLSFFFHLIPPLYYYAICIQRMMNALMVFALLFVASIVPFSQVYILLINNHSKNGCISGYDSLWNGVYSAFRNMMTLEDPSEYDFEHAWVLDFFHVLFTVLVGIMILNFLIAIMATEASVAREEQDILMRVQRLYVTGRIECHLRYLRKCLYAPLKRRCLFEVNNRLCLVKVSSSKPGKCSLVVTN